MTKEQFLQRVDELLPEVSTLIQRKALSLTASGAVEFEDFDDDYFLAKVFVAAMGQVIKSRFLPPTQKGEKIKANLHYFI